ncbi:IS256 family transposase [Blastopirellula retiformator]|uniref:Mutator family transposase n=1 Tax=Blastopirellula retiformator TaxID=2527970 RepID=A0A5C5VKS7_9BACT|nr:IS256 family transposase [Blastopirellula retiformator]TWT30578.1 Transposase, Mutator family [Blastopirellula retiformator]TWT34906.1 Transposase, Mutator family [Blastopirellula retiformator]TWT39224.1 Transposase, Mutator family [Blastopirellula retiformator]TWT39589.1 Transposase, Mutator family [Blastopirellula retiformator]
MTNVPEERTSEEIRDAIKIDGDAVRGHLDELVRSTVEETLNQMLDAEADQICKAKRYERSPDRVDSRAGSYSRKLQTKAGEVSLKVPRLRSLPLETQIIERYKRRESSVEEALVEMYLAGVSVRRVEDITEALWGTRVSSSTVSELNQKIYERIEAWRNRPLEGEHPYVMLDGIWLKRSWGGEVKNVAILVAVGVGADGHREILGVAEGKKEDSESWRTFLRYLKERGLKGVRLITSDKCLGLVEALGDFFPDAAWQRCIVHFYRNVLKDVPRAKSGDVAAMLKAVHAQEDRAAAEAKAALVTEKLISLRLGAAAKCFRDGYQETLAYMAFPREHWTRLRSNNMLERIMKEIRRRTRVVGAFPDGQSALMLVAARLRHIAGTHWGTRRYLDMDRLREPEEREDGKV